MRTNCRIRAFTLVELLVAVGITAVLAALLLAITTNTLTIWDRSVSALAIENEAQLIFSLVVQDLESAVSPPSDAVGIEIESTGSEISSIRFFTNVVSTSGEDDDPPTIREVAYIRSGSTTPYNLYRWEGTASAALSSGYEFTAPAVTTDREFLLNESIDSWRMTFWRTPTEQIDVEISEQQPRLAKLEFSLISADGAARLAAVASGQSNEPISIIREQTARVFTRWIRLRGVQE